MKDTIITFETAKLAKQKGLNDHFFHRPGESSERIVESKFCYDPNDKTKELQSWSYNIGNSTNERLERLISAPTQSLVQKWLREVHEIHIQISTYSCSPPQKYEYEVWVLNEHYGEWNIIDSYTTYEEALEAGLQEGLTLI